MMRRLIVFLLLAALAPTLAQPPPGAVRPGGQRTALLMEGKTALYQRVILRPGAEMFAQPGQGRGRPVPGFSVFYVYTRQGDADGWVEVGRNIQGATEGWVRTERTVDWRQTMVLSFTNPAGRERTMFFAEREPLRRIVLARDMAGSADQARAGAIAGTDGRVVALEPEAFVDITRNFYLLPILQAEEIENERGHRMRLLEVASAPAERRAPQNVGPPLDALRNFRGALVFVVDTSVSMQPYLDRTREAIRRVIARLGDTVLRDNFRFGLVAYRDALEGNVPDDYVVRVYARPDFGQPVEAILPQIAAASASTESNEGFDEDAIAGLNAAVREVDWNPYGGRYVVLITDAGTRDANDPRSATRLGIDQIRALLNEQKVATFAMHLLSPEGRNNHARARGQWRALTQFAGLEQPLYFPIANADPDVFGRQVDALVEAILEQVGQTIGRPVRAVRPATQPPPDAALQRQIEVVAQAMRLAYLGRAQEALAPDIVRSWTVDRDLRNPDTANLQVRVLLTRDQLSDLASTLRLVIEQGNAGRLAPQTVFANIRNAALAGVRDPRRIGQMAALGSVFGEYLDGLPYRSQVMSLTEQDWLDLQAGGQRELLNALEANLRLYEEYLRTPSLWIPFDGGRSPGEAMFPVPLEALP